MFKALLDTCVWLDLAKQHQQRPLLTLLENAVKEREIELLVPRIVIEEFTRTKARIVEEGTKSWATHLKRAKEAVHAFGNERRKRSLMEQLNEIEFNLPKLGDAVVDAVGRIEKLFKTATVIEVTDAAKLRASDRAIERRAPFHRQRNGMNDALLIEIYVDVVKAKSRFFLVPSFRLRA